MQPRLQLLGGVGVLIFSLVLGIAPNARADATVNFDASVVGPAGTQLSSAGVVFSTGFFVMSDNNVGHVVVPSTPNYLNLDHDTSGGVGTVTFVSPLNSNIPAVTSFVTISNNGLNNFDGLGWFNGIQFKAFDISGAVLDTATVAATAKPNGRPISTIQLNGLGIHSVQLTLIDSVNGSNALAPTDDWKFGTLTAVPEPSSAIVIGASFLLISFIRVSRRVVA